MRDAVIVARCGRRWGRRPRGCCALRGRMTWRRWRSRARWSVCPRLDKKEVEDVIIGCAMPEGEQGMNVARIAALARGHAD